MPIPRCHFRRAGDPSASSILAVDATDGTPRCMEARVRGRADHRAHLGRGRHRQDPSLRWLPRARRGALCSSTSTNGHLQPFVEALEALLLARDPILAVLGRHAGEMARLVPALPQQMPTLDPPLKSDPETERYRLFDAVAAWLAALSTQTPVLLVLDDLHWAEKPTLLLLRHVVRSPEPMRLLVVGTYRDTDLDRSHPLGEVLADLRRVALSSAPALGGLDVAGITELMANAAGDRMDLRIVELAQVLWSETEGNPFFVQEILLSLVESGRLVQRDGVWTTDLEIAELGIPEGVREVVGRRLSRLSEAANTVLSIASVVGQAMDVDVLVAVSALPEDAVIDALDEASSAALLRESASGTYEFTHALVRSTLYDELSATRRTRRHRQIGEFLEAHGGDAASLAYHFRRSGSSDLRALDYASAAAERALEQRARSTRQRPSSARRSRSPKTSTNRTLAPRRADDPPWNGPAHGCPAPIPRDPAPRRRSGVRTWRRRSARRGGTGEHPRELELCRRGRHRACAHARSRPYCCRA